MPLYPYACTCGHRVEIICKVDERDAAIRCRCGKPMARQFEVSPDNLVMELDREQTLGERVNSGEFKLHESFRALGVL
ncbi:MAG: hypothetical protein FWD61_11655 [Phycisphaerales bacterium]|nr:hypothetical protein [Phycisphaerales bacterium]